MAAFFIVNALSERVAKKGSVLKAVAADQNIPIYHLSKFGGLKSEVTRAARNKTSHVFIEGGDGTVQGVLTEFIKQRDAFETFPLFSIVPGGMTNQIAKNIGLKSANKAEIKKLLAKTTLPRSTALLNVISAGCPPIYGFLFSSGAIPMVTDYTKNNLHNKGIGGSLAVLGGLLRAVLGKREDVMRPTPIKLNIDSQDLNENHLGTMITTLPGLMLGMDPFWGQQDAPLRLTYVSGAVKGLYRQIAGLWLSGLGLGNKSKDRTEIGMRSWNANCVKYAYTGPVVLDGEPLSFPSGQFEIHATEPVEFVC